MEQKIAKIRMKINYLMIKSIERKIAKLADKRLKLIVDNSTLSTVEKVKWEQYLKI